MKARFFSLFAALCLLALPAFAQSAAELRDRMAQRLPGIDDLKSRGAIGENNRGFLEVRDTGNASAPAVVSSENTDRTAAYALIAKETGASPDSVGKARAKQIAASSRSGVLVQDESGAWKKK
jgi:hypothetical protein